VVVGESIAGMEFSFDRILGIIGAFGIPAGIGVGVAMDAKTIGELRFSQGCFVVSALVIIVFASIWGFTTDIAIVKRMMIVSALFCVAGLGLVESIRWSQQRHDAAHEKEPSEGSTRPFLQPRIVIDSVSQKETDFHIRIENIGKSVAQDIGSAVKTDGFSEFQPSTLALERVLPPGGHMSISIPPAVKLRSFTRLELQTSCMAKIDVAESEFTSDFKFVLPKRIRAGMEIDPEAWSEQTGTLIEFNGVDFSGSQGTMFLVADEINRNGTPNRILFVNPKKQLLVDPLARLISLQVTLNSGKVIRLEQPMPQNVKHLHIITVVWDDSKGAVLDVDHNPRRSEGLSL
jgi:hypothetical protein